MARRPRRGTLVLFAVMTTLPLLHAVDKARPFSRLQSMTSGNSEETTSTSTSNAKASSRSSGSTNPFDSLRPNEKVKFLQNVAKNGVDPIEILSRGVNSKGFQVLLKNVEIQHRILEEMPMLAAFDGFKQARGRQLSDEDTAAGFAKGVQNVLAFAKDAFVKIKDPTKTADTIAKMAADPNPAMQDLFKRAQAGDKDAVFELQDIFNEKHFPGVDASVLREIAEKHTFDKLLSMPEVMRFIDRDETLAKLFRDPTFLKQGAEFLKKGNTGGKVFTDGASTTTTTTTGIFEGTATTTQEEQQQQP